MNIGKNIYQGIIRIKKSSAEPNICDIDAENADKLKICSSFESQILLYSYSPKTSSDHFVFNPFEEYANDILLNQRTAYFEIPNQFNKLFGAILVLGIAIIFSIFKPVGFFSIEYLVSILWAYLIGKEVGDDIERILLEISKKWKIKFVDSYYSYELEKDTTMTNYYIFAKERRYGKAPLLPEKFDFNKQSNSQMLRMYFDAHNLSAIKNSSAHLFSIRFDPALVSDFEKSGFMLGAKLSFNKEFFGIKTSFELFQSIDRGSKGCLDKKGKWLENTIFYRHAYSFGRIKYYKDQGFLNNETIFG